jgi:ABC-type Zn uptake system ZnuABC Zn-binding protein ZnuA
MRRLTLACVAAVAAAAFLKQPAQAELSVITTDTTLASIAREVGGNLVKVESLSRGTDDPHAVEPRPSMIVKLARAQVFARIGMDLDMWADAVLEKSGNRSIQRGAKGYADCSQNLRVLEQPSGKLDPSMGDIHVYGNPHYLFDPANGILAAGNIAAALIRVDPANQAQYQQRFTQFSNRLKQQLEGWRKTLAPYRGAKIVTYHRSWVYFMERFGLKEFAPIEPKPGIAPSPGHIAELVRAMKAEGVRVILTESFRSPRFPNLISQQTGAKVASVPGAVEAEPGITDYLQFIGAIVDRVAAALR